MDIVDDRVVLVPDIPAKHVKVGETFLLKGFLFMRIADKNPSGQEFFCLTDNSICKIRPCTYVCPTKTELHILKE